MVVAVVVVCVCSVGGGVKDVLLSLVVGVVAVVCYCGCCVFSLCVFVVVVV